MDEIIKIDVECYSPFVCLGCPAFEVNEHTLYANDEPVEKIWACLHLNVCRKLVPHLETHFEEKFATVERTAFWEKSKFPGEKYVCSACGAGAWYYDFKGSVSKSQHCPSCGAKMIRGADE